jgi:hypothetical protein
MGMKKIDLATEAARLTFKVFTPSRQAWRLPNVERPVG